MKTVDQILDDLNKAVGKGLGAAAISLSNIVKNFLSEPAPRRIVKTGIIDLAIGLKAIAKGGRYYVATTKATPLAAPRKLSGRLRASIAWRKVSDTHYRVGTNVKYARRLEHGYPPGHGVHAFLEPTLETYKHWLSRIIGDTAKGA